MDRARALVFIGLLSIGAIEAAPRTAWAIPDCAASITGSVVYMGGTTAVVPVIRLMGARLKQIGITLLWNESDDGCHQELLMTQGPNGVRPVFSQYDEVGGPGQSGKTTSTTCNGVVGQLPDLVINDVPWTSCLVSYGSTGATLPLPAGFKEFQGPVQGLVPIVASSYQQYHEVTVEELQDLYVCGGPANILTFFTSQGIYTFDPVNSGMPELWSRGIGLRNGSQISTQLINAPTGLTAENMVVNIVAPATSPDQTLGYTSTEFYDQYRDRVSALRVRGVNQALAYYPDSDANSIDKVSIREGRYTLQGPLMFLAAVDSTGVPTVPKVKDMIDYFLGNPVVANPFPFDVNQIYAQRGVVPQCAMRVAKDSATQMFKHYKDPHPCHCNFQSLAIGTAPASCIPCTDNSTCVAISPTQACSHGYCEQVQ